MFSHFILDLLVHTPDLSIAGNGTALLGLGLWNNVPLVIVLELLVLLGGWTFFSRSKRSDARFPKQRNRGAGESAAMDLGRAISARQQIADLDRASLEDVNRV